MESISECKVPLIWNANGVVEVIKQDDVPQVEVERFIKHLEYFMDPDTEIILRPPPSHSSNDVSSESDYQDKSSIDSIEEDLTYRFNKKNEQPSEIYLDYCQKKRITREVLEHVKNISREDAENVPQFGYKEEKIHACDICGKRFSRKFNLNTHIKCVHSDDKDYLCPYCERAFNHSSNLRKHIKTVHGDEKRLPCSICNKPFKHIVALKNHMKVIHGHIGNDTEPKNL